MNYHDYLHLDKILNAQYPRSAEHGKPAHDETLFIIVHQTYELWFKQILHELDDVQAAFSQDILNDTLIYNIVSRLQRIVQIQQLMVDQVKIIETMSPLAFLEFRDMLGSSSGLQSYQFRLLEIKLGVRYEAHTIPSFSNLDTEQQDRLKQALKQPSLLTLVEKWLERTPFLIMEDFSFWDDYKQAVQSMLLTEREKIMNNATLTEQEKQARIIQSQQIEQQFNALFDDEIYHKLLANGERSLSRLATCAALLIHVYCEQPILQLPFMLLSKLVEIDTLLANYRYAHIGMVQRMIGKRMGTGGTSGQHYLTHAMQTRGIFNDLTNLSIFLVKRSVLPSLPEKYKHRLGFYNSHLNGQNHLEH
jgi:tryptophan 2,3-dioxygenase